MKTLILQSKSYEKGLLKYDRYTNTPFYVVVALGSGPCRPAFALDTAGTSYYQVRSIDFAFLTKQKIKSHHCSVIIYVIHCLCDFLSPHGRKNIFWTKKVRAAVRIIIRDSRENLGFLLKFFDFYAK